MKRVAIIGGGMAGLAAAHQLQRSVQQESPALEWELFEKSDRLGGKIITERTDGFTIEGGPDSFITQKPWGLELCRELGLDADLIPCNQAQQKVYILVRNTLRQLPAGFRLAVPTRIAPFLKSSLFSWRAKCRMGLDYVIPPRKGDDDESVQAFVTRRLGREAADKIAGPIMAGIYVADPAQLSLLATFPMFRALERKHGSLIRAMRAAAKRPAATQPMFMSMRNGMAQLVDTLAPPLSTHCHTRAPVDQLVRRGDGYAVTVNGETRFVDSVIIATPLYETADLIASFAPHSARILRAMRYASTATISLGYQLPMAGMPHPLDGFGFVVPQSEQRNILACTWSSTKFPGRAPDGHALLRVFIGGARQGELLHQSDAQLTALVGRELRIILGLTADPVLTRVYRWPQGNPQYDVGHGERMADVMKEVDTIPGLHLAGSGYKGIGLPDCIHSGREAARAVIAGAAE